ncbi:MAG: tetratricopeptide repeat protein [Archangiaceae bacterium]|nr:tetratricopeptide repeat protein [Archangiaceae bacterium]
MSSQCTKCGRTVPDRPSCMYCGGQVVKVAVVGPSAGPVQEQVRANLPGALSPEERERRFEASKQKMHTMLDAGRFADAIAAIDEGLALEPNAAHLYVARGLCLGNLGERPAAIMCFDQAIAIDATLADAWFHKADFLETLNQLDDSLSCYDEALKLDPTHAQAACDRGHVLNRLRRTPEALESFKRAITLAPNHSIAWFNKGGAELALKNFASAAASFEKFLTLANPARDGQAIAHARGVLSQLKAT